MVSEVAVPGDELVHSHRIPDLGVGGNADGDTRDPGCLAVEERREAQPAIGVPLGAVGAGGLR